MRPLNDRMTISIFRDLSANSFGLVENEAVVSHNDRPSYGRVEEVSAELSEVDIGDIVMFSRFAGVNLDRSGSKRMISLKEVMAIAESSDMLEIKIAIPDGGSEFINLVLVPGAIVTLDDDRASILGVLADVPSEDQLNAIRLAPATVVSFIGTTGEILSITTSTKSLFDDGQFIARGHKVDGKFWRHA